MTIKSNLAVLAAVAVLPVGAFADSGKTAPGQLENNLGELTKAAIENGFDQGGHSSDPSGDGHGPGTDDEPRSGLANVFDQGDLADTIEFLDQ
jgi:hypothetical protein